MKFFQDMSEVPITPMEDGSQEFLSDSVSIAPALGESQESLTELSQFSRPSVDSAKFIDTDTKGLLCPVTEPYMALQSPLPLLCSWSADELSTALQDGLKEVCEINAQGKGKGFRKVEVEKKKAIKKMRNRMSAQKSRDRKKQELDELKVVNAELASENSELRNQLMAANHELERLHKLMGSLPSKKISKDSPQKLPAKPSKKCPLLVATLLIGCFCFAACLSPMANTHSVPVLRPCLEKTEALAPVSKPLTPLQYLRRQ